MTHFTSTNHLSICHGLQPISIHYVIDYQQIREHWRSATASSSEVWNQPHSILLCCSVWHLYTFSHWYRVFHCTSCLFINHWFIDFVHNYQLRDPGHIFKWLINPFPSTPLLILFPIMVLAACLTPLSSGLADLRSPLAKYFYLINYKHIPADDTLFFFASHLNFSLENHYCIGRRWSQQFLLSSWNNHVLNNTASSTCNIWI